MGNRKEDRMRSKSSERQGPQKLLITILKIMSQKTFLQMEKTCQKKCAYNIDKSVIQYFKYS